MAEVIGLRNVIGPVPIYGVPYAVVAPILDADGDPVTGAAALDTEVSKNGDTFADGTNEATEIATTSGFYYFQLTAAEMTANLVTVRVQTSTSGAKTTPITLQPKVCPVVRGATAAGGAAGYITLDAGAAAVDSQYNGLICFISSGTGAGQVRRVTEYTGSNKQAAVIPDWATNPDNTSVFSLYLYDIWQIQNANAVQVGGVTQTGRDIGASVLLSPGTGAGQISLASGAVTVGTNADKTAYQLAADQAVNVTKFGGTAVTGRDLGASVLISAGTGAGQLDVTGGVVKANLVQILATALTETAGQIAAAFRQFFNVATPTGTVNSLPAAAAGANGGLPTVDASNAVKVQSGSGANQINLSSGLVALQSGQTVGSVGTGGITSGSFAAGAITSAAVATGAIDADALAADAVDEILDDAVEGSLTLRQAIRLLVAVAVGKSAGGGSTPITFRDQADSKNRVSATVDANGNRTAVTTDAT